MCCCGPPSRREHNKAIIGVTGKTRRNPEGAAVSWIQVLARSSLKVRCHGPWPTGRRGSPALVQIRVTKEVIRRGTTRTHVLSLGF